MSAGAMELDFARAVDQAGPHQGGAAPCLSLRVARQIVLFALALGILSAPAVAFAADSPHGFYNPSTDTASDKCSGCHKPHVASLQQGLLSVDAAGVATQSLLCFKCHGSAGPASIDIEGTFSDTLPSGHRVEDSTGTAVPDLTNTCSSCHDPHSETPGLPGEVVNGQEVTRTPQPDDPTLRNSWCLACHDPDAADRPVWSGDTTGTAYYDLIFTSRDASGYPTAAPLRTVDGTFRGVAAYNASAHATIPASDTVTVQESPLRTAARAQGDCLWCHASHRSESKYDNLTAAFGPGDTVLCMQSGCHDVAGGYGMGHTIRSKDASLPVGVAIPCYECHNPHGSRRGNTHMVSDALGGNLEPKASAEENRYFCFTCHSTQDAGIWYGWDGANWVSLSLDSTKVVGLDRTVEANALTLSGTSAHSKDNTTDGCTYLGCHGSVHNPNAGVSAGQQACYGCHTAFRAKMDANATSPAPYGHTVGVLGGSSGDVASSYPDSPGTVYCLSCHVDHDKFYDATSTHPNPSGANLRTGIADGGSTSAQTDYSDSSPYGICVSCHTGPVGGVSYTVSGGAYSNKAHDYAIDSASVVGYDSSVFQANCTKCHTDPAGLDSPARQDGQYKVAPHFSNDESRLAKALGAAPASVASTEENLCFTCHDGSTADGKDGYGVVPYALDGTQSRWGAVKSQIERSNSHGVDDPAMAGRHTAGEKKADIAAAGKHIECEDCHNPHAAGRTVHKPGGAGSTTPNSNNGNMINTDSPLLGVWGVSYTSAAERNTSWSPAVSGITREAPGTFGSELTTATMEYQICLKCHSSANTDVWNWGTDWTDVALEFNTGNSSYHPVFGPSGTGNTPLSPDQMGTDWKNVGAQTMHCSDCHGAMATDPAATGPHGSTARRILKGYYPNNAGGTPYTLRDVTNGTAADLLCLNCHPMRAGGVFLNAVHERSQHRGANSQCTVCHIARPHGGKMPRLIVDDGRDSLGGTPAPYRGTNANISRFKVGPYTTRNADCLVNATAVCGTAHAGSTGQNW